MREGSPAFRSDLLSRVTGPTAGPRFHIRFERGRGVLSLAGPMVVGPAAIGELSLGLGRVRFPISVGGGASRFRTRHTTLGTISFQLDVAKLLSFASARGVTLRVYGANAEGRFSCALVEEEAVIAFDAIVVSRGADVALAIENERRVVDDAVSAWQRLARAMRALGASFDEQHGVFVWGGTLRTLLMQALCRFGWRLPDERAVHLQVAPLLGGKSLSISHAHSLEAPTIEPGLWDRAHALGKMRSWLEQGELARAASAVAEIPARSAFFGAAQNDAFRIALDSGEELPSTSDAPLDVALRVASRDGDAALAAEIARTLDTNELSHDYVASALRVAANMQPTSRAAVKAELFERACARLPQSSTLATEALDAVAAVQDATSVERIARRALSSVADGAQRVQVLLKAGSALLSLGKQSLARELWKEAVRLDPENPWLWTQLGNADADQSPSTALVAYERAAASWQRVEHFQEAAKAFADAARMLTRLGRPDAALARIARAAEIDPTRVQWHVEAATGYAAAGAVTEATRAFGYVLAYAGDPGAASGLHAAVLFHLERRDPAAARVFLDALARTSSAAEQIDVLKERLTRLVAEVWMHAPSRVSELAEGALSDLASGSEVPSEAAESLLASFHSEHAPDPEVTRSLLGAARLAAMRARHGELLARVAHAAAGQVDAFDDVKLIEAFEVDATDPSARASLAMRSSLLHREAGSLGASALALGRVGLARNDAATLRAAIEAAARASAWADAIALVDSALSLVGQGPARAALLERREEFAASSRATRD